MLVLNAYVEIYFENSLLYIIVCIRLILYIWHVILIQLYITDVVLHTYVVECNWGYGVYRHFHQYFSYIVAVGFIRDGNDGVPR